MQLLEFTFQNLVHYVGVCGLLLWVALCIVMVVNAVRGK